MKMDHRFNKVGEIDAVFDYGKNYMDKKLNKKKLVLKGTAKYNVKKDSANINYNVTAKYPAMVSALKLGPYVDFLHDLTYDEVQYVCKQKFTSFIGLSVWI